MTSYRTPPARTLPEYRRAAMRRQLETVVTGKHRRKPLIIVASAAVVAIGTSAGAYAFVQHSQPVTDKSEARCYTLASLASVYDYTTIGEAVMAGSPGPGRVEDALSVCADLWRQGFLRPGPRTGGVPPTESPTSLPVPSLVACVLPDGTAAVFPGTRATCAALGLPDAG